MAGTPLTWNSTSSTPAAPASSTTSVVSSPSSPRPSRYSRATLTEYGYIASAVVLDALRRLFEDDALDDGARGILAGFGPGITAEISLGTWTAGLAPVVSDSVRALTRPQRPARFSVPESAL